MKKLILLGIVLVIMAVTNPSKQEYVSWLKDEVKDANDNALVDIGVDLFGKDVINKNTSADDYLFFSIYQTTFMDEQYVKAVGVFNHFLPLKISNSKK